MRQIDAQQVGSIWQKLLDRRPSVHCITNSVVQNWTANLLLAVGATPSMTTDAAEIVDFVKHSDSLLVNLGTLDGDRKQAITLALETMASEQRFVLDPVFVDRSPKRLDFARSLLLAKPAIIRCNQTEADALHLVQNHDPQTVLALSGKTDRVIDHTRSITLAHGHPYGSLITGAGCGLSALMSALLAVEQDATYAAVTAFAAYGIAQEIAAQDAEGPASFAMRLIDALHHLSADRLSYDLKNMEQA
jgi:hydroxyethylthiazole kinase